MSATVKGVGKCLPLLGLLWALSARASTLDCTQALTDEPTVHASVSGNHFMTRRGLNEYRWFLPRSKRNGDLLSLLRNMKTGHVVDVSAGEAMVLRDIIDDPKMSKDLDLTAVSYKRPSSADLEKALKDNQSRFRYFEWDWSAVSFEFVMSQLRKLSYLTLDVIGYTQYTEDFSNAVEQLIDITSVNGLIGIGLIEGSIYFNRLHPGETVFTVVNQFGNKVPLIEFYKAIQGVEVLDYNLSSIGLNEVGTTVFLKKTQNTVVVPHLKLISEPDRVYTPPHRTYLWVREGDKPTMFQRFLRILQGQS